MRLVYAFDEQAPGGRELLGGKGVGLAEMTALGIPVPAGFTVTTDACRETMRAGRGAGGALARRSDEHVARLEERTGKRFGDPADPLLVSVRSGAAVSMPGMMDTILNLGLNDVAVEGLAAATGNPRFAFDSYRRLIQMYGEVVDGVDGHLLRGRARRRSRSAAACAQDVELTADDLRELIATFKEIYEREVGRAVPAGRARAAAARRPRGVRLVGVAARAGLPAHLRHPGRPRHGRATSCRWCSATRATRRARASASRATRRPASASLFGEFLVNAQGEDVVAGIRTPEPIERMRELLPGRVRPARRHARPARGALPRDAGHRVHGRGRHALPAPDAHRQAHGAGGAADRGRDGGRGADLARGGRRADRPGPARPAAAPD